MKTFIEFLRDSLLSIVFHIAPRFASAFLFILIGHWAGPSEAGLFNLAATYLLLFTTIMRGLDDLVVRQVARELDQAARYLTSFFVLRLFLALLLYGVLVFIVYALFDYTAETNAAILILSLSVVPDGLAYTCQAILLGQRRFTESAIILALASLAKLFGGALVLANSGSLLMVAWVWLSCSVFSMFALLAVAAVRVGGLHKADWLDLRPLSRHRRAALSFLGITTLTALESQVDSVVLSGFHDKTELGFYGAATTITFSLVMLSQAYRHSVYPLMTRYALQAPEKLYKLYERSMRYMGALIMPIIAGIILLAHPIMLFLFDPRFESATKALQILIVSLFFIFLNEPNVRVMLVNDRQGKLPQFLLVSAVVNLGMNLILAPLWGATGAATSRLLSSLIFFTLNYVYVFRFLIQVNLIRLFSRSALATLVMIIPVWLIRDGPLLLSISIGIVIYVGSLWLFGGVALEDRMLLRVMVAHRNKCGSG